MPDLNAIVIRLVARTEDGKLKWNETPISWQYTASVGEIAVRISGPSGLGKGEYRLSIIDELGRNVETVSSADESPFGESQLRKLFNLARRSALDVDSILERLNRALDP